MKRLSLAALLLTFCVLPPIATWAQRGIASSGRSSGAAEINVQVRYPDGTAAPRGIHVRLESEQGGAADDCVTEAGGTCRFLPNSSGMYIVRLKQIGYKEVSAHVNLVDTLRGFVTLDLKPDRANAPTDTPDGVSRDSVSASDLSIPENARQEFEKGQSAMKENKLDAGIAHLRKAIKKVERRRGCPAKVDQLRF